MSINEHALIGRSNNHSYTGIMRCDYIAEGVIKATKELQLTVPLVVRLQGTKEKEAKQYVLEHCTACHANYLQTD